MNHQQPIRPSTPAPVMATAPTRFQAFSLQIEQEFIQGSAIDPELFQAAVYRC
jgi:hypothetical protein